MADEVVEVDSCLVNTNRPQFLSYENPRCQTRPYEPVHEAKTLASHCVSYRTFRINRTVCGLLVRWTAQTWHFTSQLKHFRPKIFHNCTDLRFLWMFQEKRVCICPQLRRPWNCRTQHICCFLQSRPSQHAVVDACQTSANEDCRYLHKTVTRI